MYTLKELKTASEKVADRYKIEYREAQNIIIKLRDTDGGSGVREILAGDFSKAEKLINPEKFQTTAKDTRTGEKIQADIIGESGSALPEGFAGEIQIKIEEFQNMCGFDDLTKISSQQWRSACIFVGKYIQSTKILEDREAERKRGGKIYNPYAVAELVKVWEYITGIYNHAPSVCDFIAFAGVSNEWFYDSEGRGLTSKRVEIRKKVEEIEKNAQINKLLDGRGSGVNQMFYLKCKDGWTETPTETRQTIEVISKVDYPLFNVPQIADNDS